MLPPRTGIEFSYSHTTISRTTHTQGTLDALVVGSGFVGLAIARCIALSGRSVGVIDLHSGPCMETSARNSEVVHAGLYYAHGSAKARLCRIGRDMLYDYCESKGVAYKKRGYDERHICTYMCILHDDSLHIY